jgi:hypothetical protein
MLDSRGALKKFQKEAWKLKNVKPQRPAPVSKPQGQGLPLPFN